MSVLSLHLQLSCKLREQLAVLLAKVYRTMALQKAASLLNLDAQHTTACEFMGFPELLLQPRAA